jgi:hypothetical protein
LVPHHVIPLFLGGPDIPQNIILWNAELHRVGHSSLSWQPQMLKPPPPLKPLPPNLYSHPPGTEYRLVGFKKHREDVIP